MSIVVLGTPLKVIQFRSIKVYTLAIKEWKTIQKVIFGGIHTNS